VKAGIRFPGDGVRAGRRAAAPGGSRYLAVGPVSVEAALLCQPLGARWAAELARSDTVEVAAFLRMYERADRAPEVLAEGRLDG